MVVSLTQIVIMWIETVMNTVGIPGLLALMFFESLGIPPLPSEVILPFAGFLIAQSSVGLLGIPFNWLTVVPTALAGGLMGAIGGYFLGRRFGMPVLRKVGKRFLLEEKDMHRAEAFFAKRGESTVLLSRMLPILRAYISYPAGAARMDPSRFAVFTVIGSFPFTVALVYVGVALGQNFSRLDPYFNALDVAAVIILATLLLFFLRKRIFRPRMRAPDHSGPVPPP